MDKQQVIVCALFSLPAIAMFVAAYRIYAHDKNKINRHVALLFVLVGITMMCYSQYYNPLFAAKHSWGIDFLYCLIAPFCAPVYFLYLDGVASVHRKQVRATIAFLPAIIYAVMLITAQILMNDIERQAYVSNEIWGETMLLESSVIYNWMVLIGKRLFNIYIAVQTILVVLYGGYSLNRYGNLLKSYCTSSSDYSNFMQVGKIHALTILIVALSLCISFIPVYDNAEQIWAMLIVVVIEVVITMILTSYILKVQYTAADLDRMIHQGDASTTLEDSSKTQDVVGRPQFTTPVSSLSLMERIDLAMQQDKLYLRSDLSLNELAEYVGTNRTYLSNTIKTSKGCNFSDYVNRYRMDYALELLKATPRKDIVMQNIVVQCGCGSIQTFYRFFKQFYNTTPTKWIELNK